jgi:hypothetical protein
MGDEFKEVIKERLFEALGLSKVDGIPINKLIFAYTMFKRLELEIDDSQKDNYDRIIVEYIETKAKDYNNAEDTIT